MHALERLMHADFSLFHPIVFNSYQLFFLFIYTPLAVRFLPVNKTKNKNRANKMSIAAGDKVFYYMTRDSLCFLTMTEARYPKRLAFLYLDEVGDVLLQELVREFGNNVSSFCVSYFKKTDWNYDEEIIEFCV